MLAHAVEHSDEDLSKERVKQIAELLDKHELKILSLRNCKLSDVHFRRLMKSCGKCRSLLQLSLSVGVITSPERTELLAQALRRNKLIKALHIHGNPIGDDGMKVIAEALSYCSHITSLDVGDCDLGDPSVQHLRLLLTPSAAQDGLSDLTLSANTKITSCGWASLSMTVAHSPNLRALYLDYNTLGDAGASSLVVGVAANQQIEILDLEGTGITEKTTQLLLDLLQNYPGNLRKITLSENKVKKSTVAVVKSILRENSPDDASVDASEDDFLSTTASTTSLPTGSSSSSSTSSSSSDQKSSSSDTEDTSTVVDEEEVSSVVKDLVLTDLEENSANIQIQKASVSTKKKKNKEKKKTEVTKPDDDDLGEELKEVPVYW